MIPYRWPSSIVYGTEPQSGKNKGSVVLNLPSALTGRHAPGGTPTRSTWLRLFDGGEPRTS